MFTFLAEVFEEFLAVNELPALGLGYSAIDFLTDGLAKMGLAPVALHEGVESLGDDGLSVLKLPSLHFFANQLFEFGTERDIHQVTSLETYPMSIIAVERMSCLGVTTGSFSFTPKSSPQAGGVLSQGKVSATRSVADSTS